MTVSRAVLAASLWAGAVGGAAADSALTCDREKIEPGSYRLTTQAQAMNLLKPRHIWWDSFKIGKAAEASWDLHDAAARLAERAIELDPDNLMAYGQLARVYLVLDQPDLGERAWQRVLDAGGAVVWTATLYDVDARTYFVMAFDRTGMRIYRFDQLAGPVVRGKGGLPEFPPAENEAFYAATGGCIDPKIVPEAAVAWSDVREIKAGNWVLWFELAKPIAVSSDRNQKRKTLDEIKVNLHGRAGEVEVYKPVGGESPGLRGRGPAGYQDLVRRTLVKFVDPEKRIGLPPVKPGVGW
jgi:tetratricopeptide repeat protein